MVLTSRIDSFASGCTQNEFWKIPETRFYWFPTATIATAFLCVALWISWKLKASIIVLLLEFKTLKKQPWTSNKNVLKRRKVCTNVNSGYTFVHSSVVEARETDFCTAAKLLCKNRSLELLQLKKELKWTHYFLNIDQIQFKLDCNLIFPLPHIQMYPEWLTYLTRELMMYPEWLTYLTRELMMYPEWLTYLTRELMMYPEWLTYLTRELMMYPEWLTYLTRELMMYPEWLTYLTRELMMYPEWLTYLTRELMMYPEWLTYLTRELMKLIEHLVVIYQDLIIIKFLTAELKWKLLGHLSPPALGGLVVRAPAWRSVGAGFDPAGP